MTDLDFAQMMQLMHSNPAAGRQLLAESLRARAENDPRMSLMLEMMQQQAAEPPASSGRSRSQRVRAALQEMREELVELHERNETLAAALGACAVCWGRVKHCSECRGRGRPGWRTPEPDLFEEFVAPAITKRGEP
jgi:hypothetical protein